MRRCNSAPWLRPWLWFAPGLTNERIDFICNHFDGTNHWFQGDGAADATLRAPVFDMSTPQPIHDAAAHVGRLVGELEESFG